MASLDRPGVEVEQTLATTSPTLARPTLVPVVVGPCNDIVEATDSKGDISSSAQLTTPALLTTSIGATFACGKRDFELTVNNGVAQKIAMPGAADDEAITPQAIINAINGVITGVVAKVTGTGASSAVVIYTSTTGAAAKLEVGANTHANVLTVFGFEKNQFVTGSGSYVNAKLKADPISFPVSKGTIAERVIDATTLRAFIRVSGALRELKDDESVLLNHKLIGNGVVKSVPALIADDDAQSANSPDFALQTTEAYVNFGSFDAKAVGSHDSAFHIRALKTGNANGAAGNKVKWVLSLTAAAAADAFTISSDGAGGALETDFDNAGPFTYHIEVSIDLIGALDNVAELVGLINAHATAKLHFVAGIGHWDGSAVVASSGTALTVATIDMAQAATTMRHGADAVNLVPGTKGKPTITSSLVYPDSVHGALAGGETLKFRVNGGEEHQVTFQAEADIDAVVLAIDTAVTGVSAGKVVHGIDADKTGADKLTLAPVAAAPDGHEATLEITGGTALTKLFGTAALAHGKHTFNSADNTKKFSIAARAAGNVAGDEGQLVDNIDFTVAASGGAGVLYTLTIPAGGQDAPTGVDIDIDTDHADIADINTYLELVDILNLDGDFNHNFVASLEGGTGAGAVIVGDTSLNQKLAGFGGRVDDITGLPIVGVHHGKPFDARKGDEVWSGGVALGRIAAFKALVQGNKTYSNAVAVLDTEYKDATAYSTWYIVAKEIPTGAAQGVTVPTPDLVVDSDKTVNLKAYVHRNQGGDVVAAADNAYLQYTALRTDVTSVGAAPALQRFADQTALDAALGPINQNNPLALAMSLAMLNATTVEVSGLGVDETSANAPDGTLDAYARAFDYLQAQEVYAVAPLSQDDVVHQTASLHVTEMSKAAQKKERMVVVSAKEPAFKGSATVGSGLDGETTAVAQEFQVPLAESNVVQELTDLGLADPNNPTVAEGIYLVTTTSARKFSVSAATNGNILTLRSSFADGENDDNFYSEDSFPVTLLNEDWSLYQRGVAIVALTDIATAMSVIAAAYGNRRLLWVQPQDCLVTIDGLNQKVAGYYACAAIVGMIAQQNPAQPLTNFPMVGLVGVQGSHDKYSEAQLSIAAGGGVYWLIQDAEGAPVISRHQLTSDLTSVETRELSILKAIDFTAKFMRGSLKRFIGRYVITDQLLNMLGVVAQGVLDLLKDTGVIASGDVTKVVADTTQPDKILLDVEIVPLYPCNTIKVTIVI
jgi:hypothetical protein